MSERSLDDFTSSRILPLRKPAEDQEQCVCCAIIQQRLQVHNGPQLLWQPSLHYPLQLMCATQAPQQAWQNGACYVIPASGIAAGLPLAVNSHAIV